MGLGSGRCETYSPPPPCGIAALGGGCWVLISAFGGGRDVILPSPASSFFISVLPEMIQWH